MKDRSLAATLHDDYRRFADRPCAAVKRDGRFVPLTYREVEVLVARASLQLVALGVAAGDRVAIVARTRLEWLVADHAIATVGAIVVPIYPTLPTPAAAHILRDSGTTVAIVEGGAEASRVRAAGLQIRILSMDPAPDAEARLGVDDGSVATLDDPRLVARRDAIRPDSLVSFLYTSGTTGNPKGVLYDHQRATAALESLIENLGFREGDVALSFLPLSHALGRGSAIAYFHSGILNCFGESIDTVAADFQLTRPTIAFTVPRVFEKAHERIVTAVRSGSPFKRRVFDWALAIGRSAWKARISGRRAGPLLSIRAWLADRLVFRKIRNRLGGRVRVLWSGGASLSPHIAEFFALAGVPIRDVYGMSEFGLSHATPEGRIRFGSCGTTAKGYEARIAEDGEILVRGHGMIGYNGLPQDTADFRDAEGWMHTGDIGRLDEDGFLFITDRKKSLIVLSNGKKVAPGPIETRLLAVSPYVLQAVVVGEGKSWLGVILHPNRELCDAHGLDSNAVTRVLQEAVDQANDGQPSWERLKRFAILEKPLTEADGDLTPTLKVKRSEVAKKNRETIERLYSGTT